MEHQHFFINFDPIKLNLKTHNFDYITSDEEKYFCWEPIIKI